MALHILSKLLKENRENIFKAFTEPCPAHLNVKKCIEF